MTTTLYTPFGKLRTATSRRYVLVGERGDGTAYAAGYSDNLATARKRARKGRLVVVDRVTNEYASSSEF